MLLLESSGILVRHELFLSLLIGSVLKVLLLRESHNSFLLAGLFNEFADHSLVRMDYMLVLSLVLSYYLFLLRHLTILHFNDIRHSDLLIVWHG